MKKQLTYLIMFVLLAIIVLPAAFLTYKYFNKEEHFHAHTGFNIYIDKELQDYSDFKYMYQGTCGDLEEKEPTNPYDKVHLHDQIGDVAHVHSNTVTWEDLFSSMKIDPTNYKFSKFYLNGVEDMYLMDKIVNQYDSAIFLFGDKEEDVNFPVTDDLYVQEFRIKEAENASESCSI